MDDSSGVAWGIWESGSGITDPFLHLFRPFGAMSTITATTEALLKRS